MGNRRRVFNLHIWGLALGYFAFYAPYSAVIKATTSASQPIRALDFLSSASITIAVAMLSILTALGWWKYANRRLVLGVSVPFPGRWTAVSGIATAAIIITTALAYSFSGVSILLALLLLRGGVLIISPIVDRVFKRRVRWFSWAAFGLSFVGIGIGFSDVGNYEVTGLAGLNLAAYLAAYAVRLPCMNAIAKSRDEHRTRGYMVEEQLVAALVLIAFGVLSPTGDGPAVAAGLAIGLLYAGLCFFGTLIYLDSRENTFCIPLNRCSSLLSGVVSSYALTAFLGHAAPTSSQLAAAAVVFLALLVLSPLHHLRLNARRVVVWITASPLLSRANPTRRSVEPRHAGPAARARARVFLFVCGGNTFRSPIAQALCCNEIARKLGISEADLAQAGIRVLSAGLTAKAGAPMKVEAARILSLMGITIPIHAANQVTPQLIEQSDAVYCMTEAQRRAVVEMTPAAEPKTQRLDPERDIEEPSSDEMPIGLGEQLRELIRRRVVGSGQWAMGSWR